MTPDRHAELTGKKIQVRAEHLEEIGLEKVLVQTFDDSQIKHVAQTTATLKLLAITALAVSSPLCKAGGRKDTAKAVCSGHPFVRPYNQMTDKFILHNRSIKASRRCSH